MADAVEPLTDAGASTGPAVPTTGPAGMSLVRVVGLHLLPGVLGVLVFLLTSPVLVGFGLPPLFTLLLVGSFVLIPFELGQLLLAGRKLHGRASFAGVLGYTTRLPRRQALVLILLLVVAGIVATVVLTPIDLVLRTALFAWLPAADVFDAGFAAYSRSALLATAVLRIVVDGVAGPLVEEAYFRGHLLPALSVTGPKAPWLNAVLFTLYHLWQPWSYPSIFASAVLLAYPVWRKRDLRLSLATHTILNLLGALLFLAAVLAL